jgi:hypothetical protein
MKVLGHDHVARNDELILGADFFQDTEKQIAPARSQEKAAATGDKVPVATTPDTTKSRRHESAILSHPFHRRCKNRSARWKGWGTRRSSGARKVGHPSLRCRRDTRSSLLCRRASQRGGLRRSFGPRAHLRAGCDILQSSSRDHCANVRLSLFLISNSLRYTAQ